jgi:hypothetical protein
MLASTALAGSWTLHLQLLVGPYERWWFGGTVFFLCLGTASWANNFWISVKRNTTLHTKDIDPGEWFLQLSWETPKASEHARSLNQSIANFMAS